jgi:hypothetical protein
MELEKLKPIVGNTHWGIFENYLEEKKRDYVARLINEEHDKNAAVLRGRLKEIDILLSLTSRIFPKRK